jgi:hypothetical protein
MDLSGFLCLVAVIFCALEAFGVGLPRFRFGWAGMALFILAVAVLGHVRFS